jgi:rhombotail lipoprotein
LVDLAVVDPKTRSLVLRAGGTDTHHGTSTLIDLNHDVRNDGIGSFDAATNQMIANFDGALTVFESDVHSRKANVRVVSRNSPVGGGGGTTSWGFIALLAAVCVCRLGYQPAASPSFR